MSEIVISVEGLSKTYQLGVINTGTFNGDVQRWWARVRGQPDPLRKIGEKDHGNREGETLMALKDISFTVQQGEALGIIGSNGAGKSTLLKILSRVTAQTDGVIKIKGKIASLLEVGTGFHPELTGRENIFLNGAVLGMNRKEIQKKFDEIVDFSGVERFIDTPVKRYSSGMYVRLAFAVAAHLEPDILIVDEVLAVGDAEFQKKCLGKMGSVSKEGRTVLFVSHNMGMINSLCDRAILLQKGSILLDGDVASAINQYYGSGDNSPYSVDYTTGHHPIGDQYATLLDAQIEDQHGTPCGEIDIRSPFFVKMRYQLNQEVPLAPVPNFHFYNVQGQCAFISSTRGSVATQKPGIYEAKCSVPGHLLNNEAYFITLGLTFTHSGIHVSFAVGDALSVIIRDPIDETIDEDRNGFSGSIPGIIRPKLQWEIKKIL